jgi:hypothetical protein
MQKSYKPKQLRLQFREAVSLGRLLSARVGGVELVSGCCEFLLDHVAEVGEVFEAFAEDVVDAYAVCDSLAW